MCMYCRCNEHKPSTTTHVVNYKGSVIIVKNVPCEECVQCGELYYSDSQAEKIENVINEVKKSLKSEVTVMDYTLAA